MTLTRVALLAMIPACGFDSSATRVASIDSVPSDAQQCFGSFVNVCLSALPTTAVTVSATGVDLDINTDSSTLCDGHVSGYCVVAATSFSVAAGKTIRGFGTRPLILVSTTTAAFELTGDIDVSSSHGGTLLGAGAFSAAACSALSSSPAVVATGASGGFGGSFGGKGGAGEAVSGNAGLAGNAVVGFPGGLRGGCAGGDGATGGVGGKAGGAVMLIAAALHLDGNIDASGAGGIGGPAVQSGGGGGGSGGMIVLESPSIIGTGSLFANGGGGAQGGALGVTGADGGESTAPLTAGAAGHDPAKAGGGGGEGSAGLTLIGALAPGTASGNGGGGAGGGGAGFIRAPGATGAAISPPST